MSAKIHLIMLCVTAGLTLLSCGKSEVKSYIYSPDGEYVIEYAASDLGAIGSTHAYVRIGTRRQKEAGKLEEIFHGTNGNSVKIYWMQSRTVVIRFCMGRVINFVSKYQDLNANRIDGKYIPTIYVQVINAPGVEFNGNMECSYNKDEWPNYLEQPQ